MKEFIDALYKMFQMVMYEMFWDILPIQKNREKNNNTGLEKQNVQHLFFQECYLK